jgi:arylsulfatase A-like enzyme
MESTAVIVMADHGFHLGERGYIGKSLIREGAQQPLPLYPEVCHIPLMAYRPDAEPRRLDALAQPVDLPPTILELLGVALPERLQGHSLVAAMTGSSGGTRRLAVASPTIAGPHLRTAHPAARATVTDGQWLLICGPSAPAGEERTAMVDSIGRRIEVLDPTTLVPHVFDLAADPGCERDLLSDSTGRAEAARLHRAFLGLLERAGVSEAQRAPFARIA